MPIPSRLTRLLSSKIVAPALVALSVVTVCAAAASLETNLPFTASRSGDKIGTHLISIIKDGDTTTVKIRSRFIVKIAFVTVYRFEHDSTEVWHKGSFWSLQAKSNDNGLRYMLNGHAEAGKFIIDGRKNDTPFHEELPGDMTSAGLWGIEMAHGTLLLNTISGLAVKVEITDLGQEQMTVRGTQTSVHHFRISGELVQDDWYDKDGYLVRKLAKAPDGSDIDFQLQ